MSWHDDSEQFAVGFVDGVVCLATKDANEAPRMVQAHEVGLVVN